MNSNQEATLTLDFEFDVLWDRRYVWQVGGVIETPEANIEFEYDISLVKGKGIGQREGLARLLKIISHYGVKTIRCHNVGAERSVLAEWCQREQMEMPQLRWIDTLKLARKMLPAYWKLSLSELLSKFGLDQGGDAHTALPDARGCILLHKQLWLIWQGLAPMPK